MTDRIMIQFRDTRLLYSNWECEGAGIYVCKPERVLMSIGAYITCLICF